MAPEGRPGSTPPSDLLPGRDYTLDERGLLVFSEQYNRRRGYCCFLACRHCPWGQAGRTPREAAADLQRRLSALEARLAAAGLLLALRGYRNGVLRVAAPPGAPAESRPEAARRVLKTAQGLLTVLQVEWV